MYNGSVATPTPTMSRYSGLHPLASRYDDRDLHGGPRSAGTPASGSTKSKQGPEKGDMGKVVLTFDDNSRKVGVAFDRAILGGVDLGQLCEDGKGYFVDVTTLRLEQHLSSDPELLFKYDFVLCSPLL